MAEETSNQNRSDATSASVDGVAGVPRSPSRPIDMSALEALLAVPDHPDSVDRSGSEAAICGAAVLQPRLPCVEWAIVWADGRLTMVETEAAARFVAALHPATHVACRIVSRWGLA